MRSDLRPVRGSARVVIARVDLAINWYDWAQPAWFATSLSNVDHAKRSSILLLTTLGTDNKRHQARQ